MARLHSSLMILAVLIIIAGCAIPNANNQTSSPENSTNTSNVINSPTYDYCLENNGTLIGGDPMQCVLNNIVYFQNTDSAINILFCTQYSNGCDACDVNNGTIACASNTCIGGTVPRCLASTEKPVQGIPLQITANFGCDQGNISVLFDNSAHIADITTPDNKTTMLAQIITGSGAAYSDQHITFFNHGDQAMVYDATNSSNIIYSNCIASTQ